MKQGIVSKRQFIKILFTAFLLLMGLSSHAGTNQNIVYQGRIVRPDGTPANSGSLTFTLSVYSPAPARCLLYSETQTVGMTGTSGMFSLQLGTGIRVDSGSHTFNKVFVNGATLSGLTCASGNSYTSSSTDDRELAVSFNDAGTIVNLTAMQIKSVPFALQAHEIDGWGLNNLVKVSTIGSATTFTTAEMANAKLLTAPGPCNAGEILKWNGTAWACASDATGAAPSDASYAVKGVVQFDTDAATSGISVTAGVAKLSSTGVTAATYGTAAKVPTITVDAQGRLTAASETTIALPLSQLVQGGATTGQILKWNGSAWAPAADAGITTESDPTVQSWAKNAPSAIFSTTGGTLNLTASGATAGTYGSGTQVPVVTVDAYGRVTSVSNTTITGTSPVGSSLTSGQMWIGNSSNVAAAVAMSGDATITSAGTLSVNKIKGQTLAGNAPSPGSLLVYNSALTQWEAQVLPSCSASETLNFNSISGAFSCATINNATNFTGSLAGDVTGTQGATTLSKIQTKPLTITSVTAGDILQYNGTGWMNKNIPTCAANQYLTFNGTAYSCVTDVGSGGTVSSLAATAPMAVSGSTGAVTVSLNYDNTTIGLNGSNQIQVKDASITGAKLGGGNNGDVLYKTAGTWTMATADTAGLVDKTSAQTISGDKTFTGSLIHNSSGATQIASGTTAQQPGTPAVGMIRVNTSNGNKPEYWNGTAWVTVGNGTVTSVSSANSYLSVANGTTTPTITANVGTSANTLAAGDDARIVGAVQRSGDTMSGALNMGSNDLSNAGNISMASNKNIQIGNFASDPSTGSWGVSDKGKTWFNTTTNELKYWDGASIKVLGVSGSGMQSLNGSTVNAQTFAAPGTSGTAPGWSTNTGTGVHTLNIPMASTSSVTAGLISKTDYDAFNNKLGTSTSFSGDVSGTYNSTSVDKIKGVGVSVTGLSSGNFLRYNGSAWMNSNLQSSDITGGLGYAPVNRAGDTMSGALNLNGNNVTNVGLMSLKGSTSGTLTMQVPATVTSYSLTWPSAVGSAGQVLSTDASGNLSWLTPNAGTVTSVSSANSYITVSNGTTTPSITANVGTAANTLAAGNDSRIVGAVQRAGDTMSGALNMGSNDLASTGNILMSANKNIQIGNYSSDPNTSGWGTSDKGKTWFNTTTNELKYWDGSAIKVLGVAGSGLQNLNGLTATTQSFAVGTSGTAPAFSSATATHTLNIPMANTASVTAGLISKTEYDTFNSKLSTATSFSGDVSGTYNATSVDKIKGTGLSISSLTSGNFLKYNGSAWINAMLDVSDIGTGVLPIARGGTNSGTALNNNRMMISSGGAIVEAPAMTNGQLMVGSTGAAPAVATVGSSNGIALTTGAGTLSIGTNATVNKTPNALIIRDGSGNFAAGAATLDQVVLAGSTSGNLTVQAPASFTNYSLTLPGTAGTNGQVLTTNGSGVLSWTTPAATGMTSLNGLTGSAQSFATATTGTDFTITSSGTLHTFAIPSSSATARGLLTSSDWSTFNNKLGTATSFTGDVSGTYNATSVDKIKGTALSVSSLASGNFLKYNGSAWVNSNLASGDITTALGYTPVNRAGDTMSGTLNMNGSNLTNLGLVSIKGSTSGTLTMTAPAAITSYTLSWPSADGSSGQFLKTDGSGNLSWGTATAPGDATYSAKGLVQFNTDPATSGISLSSGVATVNTGTAANQIVKLDASAKLPAVDGSALTNLNPSNLSAAVPISKGGTGQTTQTTGFNALSPLTTKGDLIVSDGSNNVRLPAGTNGQVLSADSTQSSGLKWVAAATGTVTSVKAGTGLTGGTITSTGTLNVDVGTGASQIVQLTAASKLPAVDGSLLTNLSASQISAGTLPIARGGTGNSSFAGNGVVVSNLTGSQLQTLNCSSGQVITFDASGYAICGAGNSSGFVNGGNAFGADANLGTTDAYALNIKTNNTTRMRINNNGNVGIGTTNPLSRLSVVYADAATSSGSVAGGLALQNTDATVGAMNSLVFVNSGNYASATIAVTQTTNTNAGDNLVLNTKKTSGGWNDNQLVLATSGNVGVSTTTPRSALDVNGALTTKAALSSASTTIDFASNNLAYTSQSCGAFTLYNMKDGGSYSLLIQGTSSATCSFTAYSDSGTTALTVHLPPDNGATTAGKFTLYSFTVFGTHVISAWTPGY